MFPFLESAKQTKSKITRQGTTGSSCGSMNTPVIGPLTNHLAHDRRPKWPLLSSSSKEIKILLLGSGQSGKSTFLKQMRILHDHSFNTVAECISYRPTINSNLLESVKTILLVMEERRVELSSVETLKVQ